VSLAHKIDIAISPGQICLLLYLWKILRVQITIQITIEQVEFLLQAYS